MTVPTIDRMVKVYADSALVERLKCGRPSESTVRNTQSGVRTFLRWLGEDGARCGAPGVLCGEGDQAPGTGVSVAIVKPKTVRRYLAHLLKANVNPVTAMSNVYQLRQLFAKWVLPYYEDHGWRVPPFPSFGKRPPAPRYNRPPQEALAKVKSWYEGLCALCAQGATHKAQGARVFPARRRNVPARDVWFAATMMLEFAMRNGDIMRLTKDNFITVCGASHESQGARHYLNYTPNKTVHSSGRVVRWPVHPAIWDQLCAGQSQGAGRGAPDLPALDDEVFDALNREMRALGFTGTKGAYELRKICIDHVYQCFGAELAVSISGDDIRTIMHYYADPAQPNIGDLRVLDLL